MLFTAENCKKYGLPKNYLTELIEADFRGENINIPYDDGVSWAVIEELENNKTYEKGFIEYLKQERIAFDEFTKKQEPFDKALKDYLEIPKSELFIELKKGNVKSSGRKIPHEFKARDYIYDRLLKRHDKNVEIEGEPYPKFTEIPIQCWVLNKVNWDDSVLDGEDFRHCHVIVDTESLFRLFPEPELQTTKVFTHNGTLLIDKNNKSFLSDDHERRGRKEKFNRKEINAEIIRRFMSGQTTKYQNAFIIEIQEWCERKWGRVGVPSEAYLKEFTSPFYNQKKGKN